MKYAVVLYAWGPHKTTFDTMVTMLRQDEAPNANTAGLKLKDRLRFVGDRGQVSIYAALLKPKEAKGPLKGRRLGDILVDPEVSLGDVGMIMVSVLGTQVEHLGNMKKRLRK